MRSSEGGRYVARSQHIHPPLTTIVIAAVREEASGDDLRLTTFLYVAKATLA